jgi:uncharacterized protein involved in exopolysaccharide biosynthesis
VGGAVHPEHAADQPDGGVQGILANVTEGQSQGAAQGSFDLNEQALPIQDFAASVFRHRRMVLSLIAIGVVAATLRAWFMPPTYKASSVLMVRDNRARLTVSPDDSSSAVLVRGGEGQMSSLMALATSPALIQDVLMKGRNPEDLNIVPQQAGIIDTILDLPNQLYRKLHEVPEPSLIERQARGIVQGIVVTPVESSSFLQIDLFSGSPEWSADFLNKIVDEVIKKYTKLYDTTEAQQFYRGQRDLLSSRVEAAQAALNEFRDRVGPEMLTLNAGQLRDRISGLEQSIAEAKTQIAELRARQTAPDAMLAEGGTVDPVSPATIGSGVYSIKARIVELEIKRGELLSRYAPGSAMIGDVNRQIAEARRLLAQEQRVSADLYRKEAGSQIDSAEARIVAYEDQLNEYRVKLAQVETITPEWERLTSDLDTQRQAYQTYLRKEEEARVSNALDESDILNVAVAQKATIPRDPEASPVLKLVVFGAGAGLVLGVGIALFRDWLDPSVKTTSQAERMTGIPVLGEIPL